jgi:hypothetical protein
VVVVGRGREREEKGSPERGACQLTPIPFFLFRGVLRARVCTLSP